jgi:signal transduction histidine kinase/ActR/RegA family two-component response regulator
MILVNIVTFLGATTRFQITLIIYATTYQLRLDFSEIIVFRPIWLLRAMMRRPYRLCAFAALLLALEGSGSAQQSSFRHYGAPDGLQNLWILSLAQDGAGYIRAGVISIAGLPSGRHGLQGAALEFQIEPKWWETWWLRSSVLLLFAAAVWGIGWRRNHLLLRRRTAELEAEHISMLEEKKSANAALEAKGLFLANVSHEIRTPLNGVIGLTMELEAMPVPADALEIVRMIRSSGDTLLRVIGDVLDFSKVEAGKLELEVVSFELRRALEESVTLFRAAAAEKDVRLGCSLAPELPAWVSGDGTRLRQVVMNLISNAVKFTSSGEITLAAGVEWHDAASYSIAIEVRDTGIGIASEHLPRLFSSFNQADASISRRYGGTGLGLAISKRLVELMGGTIDVESKLGEGTRFRFTVRLGHAQEPAALPDVPAAALSAGHLRVLVAEDNEINQRVAVKLLERLGVKADLAADGAQAVTKVMEHHYDLVLMDVQMPELDGLSATQEIRRLSPAGGQPLIFGLTAHVTMEFRDTCLAAGMNGYLTKPLEPEKLRALIAELSTRNATSTMSLLE